MDSQHETLKRDNLALQGWLRFGSRQTLFNQITGTRRPQTRNLSELVEPRRFLIERNLSGRGPLGKPTCSDTSAPTDLLAHSAYWGPILVSQPLTKGEWGPHLHRITLLSAQTW